MDHPFVSKDEVVGPEGCHRTRTGFTTLPASTSSMAALISVNGYVVTRSVTGNLRSAYRRSIRGTISGGSESPSIEPRMILPVLEDVDGVDRELRLVHVQPIVGHGPVEEGVAELTTVLQRSIDAGAEASQVSTAVMLTDAYLWLLRFRDGVEVGRRSIERGRAHGYRETYGFALLVANTAECLLLGGEQGAAEELVAAYLPPEPTANGWPLSMVRAELDLASGDLTGALTRIGQVQMLGYHNDELWTWLAEVGAEAELWLGHPRPAWERGDRVWTQIRGSQLAKRFGRALALTARAAGDLADSDQEVDREGLARQLRERAAEARCFTPHPARVLGAAYATNFFAELARLQRAGQESAWRAAKDTWASHDVPHHAAYAGWRLALCLLDRGRRNDGHSELVAAYGASEHHEPLRQEIEALARRARLPLEAAPSSRPQRRPVTPRPAASHRVSWMSSGCSAPAPATTRSHMSSSSARRPQASMSPTSFASSASMDVFRQPWSLNGWGCSPPAATRAGHPERATRGDTSHDYLCVSRSLIHTNESRRPARTWAVHSSSPDDPRTPAPSPATRQGALP